MKGSFHDFVRELMSAFYIYSKTGSLIFSEKVVAQWKKAEEDEFGHDLDMLKWARDGGEYPPVI